MKYFFNDYHYHQIINNNNNNTTTTNDNNLKGHNLPHVHAPYFDLPTGCRKFTRGKKLY